ncbi:MAG: flagellar filament capping protein FliD [Phycisphaerales bacterium]
MGGIASSVGLISGIDTGALIEQLLQIEARPRTLAANRLIQLQTQQAAFLDLNTRFSAVRTAASTFRNENVFSTSKASSSEEETLTASATTSAQPGSYTFIVDRLVSTQQQLSKGFSDFDSTAFGAESFTLESSKARLDSNVELADLNGGAGVRRGIISITNSNGTTEDIDLSKVGTVSEALDAINSANIGVRAETVQDQIVLTDTAGGPGQITVADGLGDFTATDLGIAGTSVGGTLTGTQVYYATETTSLGLINGSNGIETTNSVGTGAFDFTVRVDGTDVKIYLGTLTEVVTDPDTGEDETVTTPPAATLGDVINRINDTIEEQLGPGATVTASLKADGTGLQIVDSAGTAAIEVLDKGEEVGAAATQNTARQLGINGTGTGSVVGTRIFGGLNSILTKTLNGGQGITGDGNVSITDRNGVVHNITGLTGYDTLNEALSQFDAQSGGAITASLNELGNGLVITDTTGGGGNLIIAGTPADNTAASLGIETDPAGVAENTVDSGNLQKQYIGKGTLLSSLNNGAGIGTGSFEITDATGTTQTVTIGQNDRTIGHVINAINSTGLGVVARINDQGDGIIIEEDTSGGGAPGSVNIKIEDSTGSVAELLKFEGESSGTDADNFIDGSFETTIDFETTDTLEDVIVKINEAGVEAIATVVNDGSSTAPYRISFTARNSGEDGRFILDTNGFDLALSTLSEGNDARVFFGSGDPANALLVSSSTNSLDELVQGVTIDLNGTSEDPVTLNISRDLTAIEERVNTFVSAFNTLIERIDNQTRYDDETEARGPLLGDSLALTMRQQLFSVIQTVGDNVTGQYQRLSEVGITIGDGGNGLSFDSSKFREAYENDPASVEALFETYELAQTDTTQDLGDGISVSGGDAERAFESLGVIGKVEELARDYLDSVDGILTQREQSLTTQVEAQEARIDEFTVRLEARRAILEQQFLAMEQALGELQAQQSSLTQLAQLG